jgi:uncharacterized cupin superfamily protein
MQEPTIINIFDHPSSSREKDTIDFASPFGLDRIKVEYVIISNGTFKEFSVAAKKNHMCYIIAGSGSLESNGRRLALTKDSCFSFAASGQVRTYSLIASSGEESIGALVLEDIEARDYTKKASRS